jgi:hypothetical protein
MKNRPTCELNTITIAAATDVVHAIEAYGKTFEA